jgi:hypothetical protein
VTVSCRTLPIGPSVRPTIGPYIASPEMWFHSVEIRAESGPPVRLPQTPGRKCDTRGRDDSGKIVRPPRRVGAANPDRVIWLTDHSHTSQTTADRLVCVAGATAEACLRALHTCGDTRSAIIGTVRKGGAVPHLVWCLRNSLCTEGADAPGWQGATTEDIGPYLREEQRRRPGCSDGRMPSYFGDTTLVSIVRTAAGSAA